MREEGRKGEGEGEREGGGKEKILKFVYSPEPLRLPGGPHSPAGSSVRQA